jgi:hypothetical protein
MKIIFDLTLQLCLSLALLLLSFVNLNSLCLYAGKKAKIFK